MAKYTEYTIFFTVPPECEEDDDKWEKWTETLEQRFNEHFPELIEWDYKDTRPI